MKQKHTIGLANILAVGILFVVISTFTQTAETASMTKVVKSVDESTTGFDIPPQDDDELALVLNKNKKYVIRGTLFPHGEGSDMRIAATVPNGAVFVVGYDSAQGTGVLEESGVEAQSFGLDEAASAVSVDGIVTMGNQSGEFRLQWGQFSSEGSTTTVKSGSFLIAEPI
ncbi:MAG: hypothetical protein G01um101448_1008 [Parcubacteria group bacterium Gr01-1014_48]|nr:MAG: hypothetical protein Greene041614_337 [Parcubacteria group bacterium Greene0416_14]TSC72260.1 MAG: hypothetical protein G01um101448_1008 [Parcubacteria group bacterium Gr01-1014_48]TSD07230.1 MAG: hypothetical protein Greene07144_955 [Parcubacteria group bacterium Greene0714_4]